MTQPTGPTRPPHNYSQTQTPSQRRNRSVEIAPPSLGNSLSTLGVFLGRWASNKEFTLTCSSREEQRSPVSQTSDETEPSRSTQHLIDNEQLSFSISRSPIPVPFSGTMGQGPLSEPASPLSPVSPSSTEPVSAIEESHAPNTEPTRSTQRQMIRDSYFPIHLRQGSLVEPVTPLSPFSPASSTEPDSAVADDEEQVIIVLPGY